MAEKKDKIIVTTPEFRASFVNLLKPRAFEDGDKPTYNLMIVLDKAKPEHVKCKADLEAKLLLAAKASGIAKPTPQTLKHWPIRDADAEGKDNDALRGCWYVSAKNQYRVDVCDANGVTLLSDQDIYSGMWCRVQVSCFGWSGKFGKGVSVGLEAVMKCRDGERFGGGVKAASAFADFIADNEPVVVEEDAAAEEPAQAKAGKGAAKRPSLLD